MEQNLVLNYSGLQTGTVQIPLETMYGGTKSWMVWIDCGKTVLFKYVSAIAVSTWSDHENIKGICYAVAYSVILFAAFWCSFINKLGLRFGGEGKCIVTAIISSDALLIVYPSLYEKMETFCELVVRPSKHYAKLFHSWNYWLKFVDSPRYFVLECLHYGLKSSGVWCCVVGWGVTSVLNGNFWIT